MTPSFENLKDLFGIDIGARLWRGLVSVDLLIRMVCEIRPYELERGQTDEVHAQNLRDIETAIATDELSAALTMATSRLRLIPVDRSVPRPVVGVAGDIFTRINPVGNQDLFAGQTAARNMLGADERFAMVPFFWSTHYDVTVAYLGHAELWERMEVDGDPLAHDCRVEYFLGGKRLAVATVGRDRDSLLAETEAEAAVAVRPKADVASHAHSAG